MVCKKNWRSGLQRINLSILLRSNQNNPHSSTSSRRFHLEDKLSLKEKAPAVVLEVEASEIAFTEDFSLLL